MTKVAMTPADALLLFWRKSRNAAVPLTIDELSAAMGRTRPDTAPSIMALVKSGYLGTFKRATGTDYPREYFATPKGEAVLRRAAEAAQ